MVEGCWTKTKRSAVTTIRLRFEVVLETTLVKLLNNEEVLLPAAVTLALAIVTWNWVLSVTVAWNVTRSVRLEVPPSAALYESPLKLTVLRPVFIVGEALTNALPLNKAADRIIDEVWQLREGAGSPPATPPAAGDAK